jgi:hypothetical protein
MKLRSRPDLCNDRSYHWQLRPACPDRYNVIQFPLSQRNDPRPPGV